MTTDEKIFEEVHAILCNQARDGIEGELNQYFSDELFTVDICGAICHPRTLEEKHAIILNDMRIIIERRDRSIQELKEFLGLE